MSTLRHLTDATECLRIMKGQTLFGKVAAAEFFAENMLKAALDMDERISALEDAAALKIMKEKNDEKTRK